MVLISNDTADFADTTPSRERLPAHEDLARPEDRCGQLTPDFVADDVVIRFTRRSMVAPYGLTPEASG
jgi:hypothetical protein